MISDVWSGWFVHCKGIFGLALIRGRVVIAAAVSSTVVVKATGNSISSSPQRHISKYGILQNLLLNNTEDSTGDGVKCQEVDIAFFTQSF